MNNNQKGFVLVIVIITLTAIAALSIVAITSVSREQNSAARAQDQFLAKQSADYAIDDAKQLLLQSWAIGAEPECNAAPCNCTTPPCVWAKTTTAFQTVDLTQQTNSWWNTYGTATANKPHVQVISAPRYIIINLGCDRVAGVNRFRIVTRGSGRISNTAAFSDVTYSMPLSNQNTVTPCSGQKATAYVKIGASTQSSMLVTVSPSTVATAYANNNPAYFFRITEPNVCPQSGYSYATCEMNCAGQVRVMGWSYDHQCVNTYGPWAAYGLASEIRLLAQGTVYTLGCALSTNNPPCTP